MAAASAGLSVQQDAWVSVRSNLPAVLARQPVDDVPADDIQDVLRRLRHQDGEPGARTIAGDPAALLSTLDR